MGRRFVVLGGAGTIGRVVARDLFESHGDNQILIADYNEPAARALTKSFKDLSRRVRGKFCDARETRNLIGLLKGKDVVVNCLQHDFNLAVMAAALAAGVHYVDLGGLFYWTRKQLRLNKKFRDRGLTAVIGSGCAPGITNLLVAYAAKFKDKIRSLKIRVGSIDFNPPSSELRFSYSAQTIIQELTLRPWIFRQGKFQQIAPRIGWELTDFPEPVGKAWTLWTRHSEVATLPLSFRDKGLQYCDFKVGFDRDFVAEVMKRFDSGWTIQDFNKLLKPATAGKPAENPNDYEISRVIVDDTIVDCHANARPDWQASAGDIDTACPISIVAQMIADGNIDRPGVAPPEIAVPTQLFFPELKKRGLKIITTKIHA